MKPHIRRRFGIWCCSLLDPETSMALLPLGHGYRPDHALIEWWQITQEALAA